MDEPTRAREIYDRLTKAAEEGNWTRTTQSYYVNQPFKALMAAMLSAQTREEQTLAAMNALMALAETPEGIAALTDDQIAKAIRPVMYWEPKVRYVRDIAEKVAANGGIVPKTVDELTEYKGVGWKVAVLTLATGYGITDDITVDVHVGRIAHRLGLVSEEVKQPPKINDALKKIVPRDLWAYWNGIMVRFGRAICQPTYPQCDHCPLRDLCPQIGVVALGRGRFKNAEYQ